MSWLLEYCDPGLGPEELGELLSMRAVEVERVSRIGVPSTEGFVVGLVVAAEQHPNADRLRICEVETGDDVRTIVCGAPNVAGGQAVAVALPGALMPDGRELGRAKLRGVESDGMILSERELELGDDHDGIMVLETGAAPGTPLAEVLPIAEAVLELDLNPNRVDCMGVYGVAREVHAITGAPLAAPPWETDAEAAGEGEVGGLASVTVEVPELCPRFSARVLTGIDNGPSPPWLAARLIAAGMRPISAVVDVTNYVMLMTAQPLHAFDLDKVPGGELIIRTARAGERMTTLDGVERSLGEQTVLVCDREEPAGIAGIMGGEKSEVSASTTRVLLEVATWNGPNILRSSSMLGLRSDASARYEKQLHPELALRAQRIASRLLVELAGARLVPGTIDVAADVPTAHIIPLRGARLHSLLGVHIDEAESEQHLTRLGFEPQPSVDRPATSTEFAVPFHRHYDVTREVDLIEEVGRLHGFDRLPRTLPAHAERVGGLSREQTARRRAEDVMRDLGFDEIVSWAFVPADLADRLRLAADDPRRQAVATRNPISEDHVRMRTTLLGGLLDAARHNRARDAERIALFESGRAYLSEPAPEEGGPLAGQFAGRMPAPVREPHRLAALAVGDLAPASWAGGTRPDAFFALKGVAETLARQVGAELRVAARPEPFLHPGRAAALELGGVTAGWLGQLHPLVAREWDLPGGTAFEIDLAPLVAAGAEPERYLDLTTFPAVLQDLAVTVDESVPAERVRDAVRAGGGELLVAAEIFDVYHGEQLAAGEKSLALRLEFRAPDRTLTDAEVGEVRERIRAELDGIGGALRE
jgi:phenylalanyl-tRNA synthetase beta chain